MVSEKLDTILRFMVTALDDVLEDLHKAKSEAEDKREYQKENYLEKNCPVQRQFGEKQMWQVTDQQRREVSHWIRSEILSRHSKRRGAIRNTKLSENRRASEFWRKRIVAKKN